MSTTPQDARQLVKDMTMLCGEPSTELAARMQYTLEALGYAVDDVPPIAAGAVVLLSMLAGLIDELRDARAIDPMQAEAATLLVREFCASICTIATPEVVRG